MLVQKRQTIDESSSSVAGAFDILSVCYNITCQYLRSSSDELSCIC